MSNDHEENARRLRQTLDEIPGAREAFRSVLADPKVKAELAAGVTEILRFAERQRSVGPFVALAEIADPRARMEVATALAKAYESSRAKPKAGG